MNDKQLVEIVAGPSYSYRQATKLWELISADLPEDKIVLEHISFPNKVTTWTMTRKELNKDFRLVYRREVR